MNLIDNYNTVNDYNRTYDIFCIMTSLTILCLALIKLKQIDFCYLFILSAIFSITWRIYKISKQIKFTKQVNFNPLFICDFFTATFLLICLMFKKEYSKSLLCIIFLFLFLAWGIRFYYHDKDNKYAFTYANMIHSFAHISAVIFFIFTFYILSLR